MLDRNQIKKIIVDKISQQTGTQNIKIKETSKLDELGLDSLDIIEIIMAVEEAMNISIPDSAFEITTVKQMIDYVVSLKPDNKDYMKASIQLRMMKNKDDNSKITKFKKKHMKLFNKMSIK